MTRPRRFLIPLTLLGYAEAFPHCAWWAPRILLYIAAAFLLDCAYGCPPWRRPDAPQPGPPPAR